MTKYILWIYGSTIFPSSLFSKSILIFWYLQKLYSNNLQVIFNNTGKHFASCTHCIEWSGIQVSSQHMLFHSSSTYHSRYKSPWNKNTGSSPTNLFHHPAALRQTHGLALSRHPLHKAVSDWRVPWCVAECRGPRCPPVAWGAAPSRPCPPRHSPSWRGHLSWSACLCSLLCLLGLGFGLGLGHHLLCQMLCQHLGPGTDGSWKELYWWFLLCLFLLSLSLSLSLMEEIITDFRDVCGKSAGLDTIVSELLKDTSDNVIDNKGADNDKLFISEFEKIARGIISTHLALLNGTNGKHLWFLHFTSDLRCKEYILAVTQKWRRDTLAYFQVRTVGLCASQHWQNTDTQPLVSCFECTTENSAVAIYVRQLNAHATLNYFEDLVQEMSFKFFSAVRCTQLQDISVMFLYHQKETIGLVCYKLLRQMNYLAKFIAEARNL